MRRYGLEDRVTALARKLKLPVVTTFMGRGLLEEAPDVLSGTYLGAAGDAAITRLVEEADALLLLGVIFSDTNFALSQRRLDPRRTIRAFDRAVQIGHHGYANIPLAELVDALAKRARPLSARWPHPKPNSVPYRRGLSADNEAITPSAPHETASLPSSAESTPLRITGTPAIDRSHSRSFQLKEGSKSVS